ncbi:MAG: PQQ-binding-like beta-propeller repeat protein [Vicinamibacterales bacterium]
MRLGRAMGTTAVVTVLAGMALSAAEWPQWRGPRRDGVAAETGLLKTWPSEGPPLAWRASGAGNGYSSFAVAGGRLYTLGAKGPQEFVIAYEVASGKSLWEAPIGPRLAQDRGDGPRGTPTIDGNRVYAIGGRGDLACVDLTTGKKIWGVSFPGTFSATIPNWGYAESPLVAGDRVIVNAGGDDASIVAFEKVTGKVLWKSGNDRAAYSSAMLHEAGGVRQAIFFTATNALGVDVANGRILWTYNRANNDTANVSTPVVRGDRVFISSDYGTGGGLLQLSPSGGGAKELYFTADMRTHHNTAVLVGDHMYGFSSSILTAMKFDDATVAWKNRSVGKGSLVAAEGQLYLFGENGVAGLADATPQAYRERGRFQIKSGNLPTWTHPVVSDGRLYLRDQDSIYAYDVKAR